MKQTPTKTMNGGLITSRKKFLHPHCLMQYVAGYTNEPIPDSPERISYGTKPLRWETKTCTVCGDTISDDGTGPIKALRFRASRLHTGYVCQPCSQKTNVRQCSSCGYWLHPYNVSKAVHNSPPLPGRSANLGGFGVSSRDYCDACADALDVETVKSVKASERRKRKEQERFEAIRTQLQERLGDKKREG